MRICCLWLVFFACSQAFGDAAARALAEWNTAIMEAIQLLTPSPCLASRNLAVIHLAAFDAVNAVQGGYEPYLDLAPPGPGTDAALAALGAVSTGARAHFPASRASFDELFRAHRDSLSTGIAADTVDASVAYGEYVARAHIGARVGDGATTTVTYIPVDKAGKWRRTPPRFRPPEVPHWPTVRPFAVPDPSAFRPPPPPSPDTPQYAEAWDEVRRLGARASTERTSDQTEIAVFWSCFSYTSTPAGHWNEIGARIALAEGMPLLETARLLALVNAAMADAGIACWNAKYHYGFWRPIHAIRFADNDGNPATTADPEWDSLLEAPPHPCYVSGHAAFSGAGSRTLAHILGTDAYAFRTTSSSLPGVERAYRSFSECTDEICMSRVYGGIHFRFSNEAGRVLGEEVADAVHAALLRPR
ncbi:MAG: phosphatase PAP2 family protein [Opitutales bacterium]|nr:phosphatase PAP2 family protein [Opitutales bacterium]